MTVELCAEGEKKTDLGYEQVRKGYNLQHCISTTSQRYQNLKLNER